MTQLICLNKPFQVLSQFTDTEGRSCLADFIHYKGYYPAGRLDYDSEGLILLTDNGQLQKHISHPDKKMPKTYWVQVEGNPTQQDLEPLRAGIKLKDGRCKQAKVRQIPPPNIWERHPPIRERKNLPTSWLEIILKEGKNRQVRRMTAAIGFPTLRLIRYAIGPWNIDTLKSGHWVMADIPTETLQEATKPAKKNTHQKRKPRPKTHR
ncbi:MAG: pseudouridine synthase [Pseudomonadales bacterium]|nr:pseudouridine synthase [Pseudomonadales bacterium]